MAPTESLPEHGRREWLWLFCSWLLALIASLGVLFVGEVMGQVPCNLCWYQRVFMFPLAIILGVASLRADVSVWRYALPLAVGGMLVAGFHSLLYLGVIPERITPCSQGVSCRGSDMTLFGSLPLPLLAIAVFTVISILLLLTRARTRT